MADNVAITPGMGATVAADEIAGALHQRVKITIGADGTNDGDVASGNPLPVVQTGALPAGTNAIGKLAANSGVDIGDVDVTSCALPTGASTEATLSTLNGKVTACNTGAVVLAAGTAAIGKLTANSGVDIGDVDVISCALPTGAATESTLSTLSGKVTACNTGAVVLAAGTAAIGKLAANSGVDIGDVDVASVAGNVTVVQGTAGNLNCTETNSGAIKTAVELIDNAISGSEMQVDVVASLPAGTNAIGKLAANSGVDIGDVDVLSLPALTAGTASIGQIQPSKYPTTDDAEYMKKYYTYSGAVTDGVVWSPGAGKRWYVTDLIINVSAAATVTLEDDLSAGDAVVLKCELAANGGFCKRFATPLASGEDAADLLITTSAGNVYVTAVGYEV